MNLSHNSRVYLVASTYEPQKLIEQCARISYQSSNTENDPKVTADFIRGLVCKGHESPLEHASATFFIKNISRACSHQFVRHRLMSITQRSDRYSVPDGKFINPFVPGTHEREEFDKAFKFSWDTYKSLLEAGFKKEDARLVLPTASVTSMYATANFRERRHFLELRLSKHAQWEIRAVAEEILDHLLRLAPDCFFDFVPVKKGLGHDNA